MPIGIVQRAGVHGEIQADLPTAAFDLELHAGEANQFLKMFKLSGVG